MFNQCAERLLSTVPSEQLNSYRRIGDEVINLFEKVRWLDGAPLQKLVFQPRGYTGMQRPDSPIRAYLLANNIQWVATDPLMRKPGCGTGLIFNLKAKKSGLFCNKRFRKEKVSKIFRGLPQSRWKEPRRKASLQ